MWSSMKIRRSYLATKDDRYSPPSPCLRPATSLASLNPRQAVQYGRLPSRSAPVEAAAPASPSGLPCGSLTNSIVCSSSSLAAKPSEPSELCSDSVASYLGKKTLNL